MGKLSIKNLLANKARLALTGFAVILGVSFVVASFVLSDGLSDSFGTLSREIYQGTDVVVRESEELAFGEDATIDAVTLAAVQSVEGVDLALGSLGSDTVQPVRADGSVVTTVGPPIFAFNWMGESDLNQLTMETGRAPAAGEFVIDRGAAAREGFTLGETYGMVSETGSYEYTLVGTSRFGVDNTTNGAILMAFDEQDLRDLTDFPGTTVDSISVAVADGYTASEVQAGIDAVLTPGLESVNQQSLEEETAAEFNEGINIVRNVLLGFAGVSLFVSTFIIYNTFGIVLAQRVRELGLLRAIGADAAQIRRSIIIEAFIIGVVASAVGILGGIALNYGLIELFNLLGIGLPDADLVLAPRTVTAALVIGIGVTVLSSLAPALRAAKVSPIAAMSDSVGGDTGGGRLRIFAGLLLTAAGFVFGAIGLQGGDSVTGVIVALSAGAIGIFFGVALLSPLFAKPVVDVVAWPIARLRGVSGMLARRNAGRHPRRTATTAAALMIGLSLVTTALVVGQSLKAQIGKTLDTAISADYLVAGPNFDPFPSAVAAEVAALPEIGDVVAISEVPAEMSDEVNWYNTADFDSLSSLFDLDVDRGVLAETGEPAMMLPTEEADELGLSIGDSVRVTFENGTTETFNIVATYKDQSVVDGRFMNALSVETAIGLDETEWLSASVADGYTAAQAEAAMDSVQASFPQLDIQSSAEYRETIEGEIDGLLNIISALLALAIFIALLGIGLTLALAVVERTRELGLLRAVGMTRAQMRGMIRWEAAAIALFGAVLGVAVGLLFGWASVIAMPDSFITTVSIPVGRLAILTAVAGAAGLVAALLPARRAGRLNVLEAIAMG